MLVYRYTRITSFALRRYRWSRVYGRDCGRGRDHVVLPMLGSVSQ